MRRWLVILGFLSIAVGLAQSAPIGALYGSVPVVSVVDGDSFVVESNVGPRIVRLLGVDAPETQHPTLGRPPMVRRQLSGCAIDCRREHSCGSSSISVPKMRLGGYSRTPTSRHRVASVRSTDCLQLS